MKLDWNDINDIAISLFEKFPDTDPQWIGFPDLHKKILELSDFECQIAPDLQTKSIHGQCFKPGQMIGHIYIYKGLLGS